VRLTVVLIASAVLLSLDSPVAHHSVAGEFDGTKPVTLEGVITRIKWESPHVWVYLDARDPGGKIVNWAIECAPPARMGSGVREALRVGDRVTINAYRARDPSRTDAHAYDIVLADGRRMIIGLRLN
jgi:hypothetical protein